MSPKHPQVVAELGRPETPAETADRKAEASRNHRERQTINNLVYALIATLALVALIVLIVPRGNPIVNTPVDYAAIAAQAQGTEPGRLVVPVLPKTYTSNSAQLNTQSSDGVDSWYIGLLTPDHQYIGITQGFNANATWLANQVDRSLATGTATIDGVQWTIYDNRNSGKDNGNVDYALTATAGHSTYVVFGTAGNDEFTTVVRAISPQVRANRASA